MGEVKAASSPAPGQIVIRWLCDVLLIGVLLLGAYFRFTGLNWDQNQHLHPDERFLTMVETGIDPVQNLGEYFDTNRSSLNPNNRGFGFYVYGTLPLFAVRYAGEWLGKTGYDEIFLVGRQLSGVMDLGVVLLVYLIAARLYNKRPLALLAAAFAAFSVLPIQLSHYFTVDTFTNFFGMLAVLFAVWLLPKSAEDDPAETEVKGPGSLVLYILFGLALGMAAACKINAIFLAALLPGAVAIRYFRQSKEEREHLEFAYLGFMVLAGVISFLAFRVFQPFAFTGPGFFNVLPSQQWINSLRSLAQQSTGYVDFPPALQWARRPITFALTNMVVWGLGLPLGILAWSGFLWMGYRLVRSGPRGEWDRHLLIWAWTGLYFTYQAVSFVRSMRYQMLVYPTLAIIAAWAVFALWEKRAAVRWGPWLRAGAVLVGVSVLVSTAAYAFSFSRIYTRPVTRVEASRWIYQNIPGPINLRISADGQVINQPVAFRSGYVLRSGQPLVLAFRPRQDGQVASVTFEHLSNASADTRLKTLTFSLSATADGANPITAGFVADSFQPEDDQRGRTYTATFDRMVPLQAGQLYYLIVDLPREAQALNVAGSASLLIQTADGLVSQALPEPVDALVAGKWYQMVFNPVQAGTLSEVVLEHVVDWENRPEEKTLRVMIYDMDNGQQLARSAELLAPFTPGSDVRGERYTLRFEQPLELRENGNYAVRLEQVDGPGALAIYGSRQANESSWDDALPLSLDGYNPYDYAQGVYRSDLNFEMYWDDNPAKLARFQSILDQADYLFISSNRQWGTTTRVPERYPLTTEYYRQLLGCPEDQAVTWCYSVAEPGMFTGKMGYELAAVFQSDPNLGSLRFNTQFAEEAFTVYDAPKVLIFRKTTAYDPDKVRAILGKVDLSTVVTGAPATFKSFPANLLLPPARLRVQRAGGTWAELFSPDALFNRYPILAALLWYIVISLLGWVVYPFTRLALRGLPDRGFPFARLVGMLALAYPVWLLGSYGVPFSSVTVTFVFAMLLVANLWAVYRSRKVLLPELRERWRSILTVELLFLAFFTLFLLVRMGNGDLWHPWKGGEKPMDFSYFNAVLKSTTFPPYDPWFAGGYINYYYYGFVIVGVPVKWLGITPSIAYNLILPTLFAMLALGAFSIGWNLFTAARPRLHHAAAPSFGSPTLEGQSGAFAAGLFSALALSVLGNWGTVRMVWHGVQKVAGVPGDFNQASLLTHIGWTFQGLWFMVSHPGTPLPYSVSDWYWIPSRALPGWTITEFPAFTFLYGDPHAHMFALPLTVLALGWALSVLLGRWGWKGWGHRIASFLLGGLVIGALKPTNTWDWPTFLALACVAAGYSALRYGQPCCLRFPVLSTRAKRVLSAVLGVGALVALSALLYQPFDAWYGGGYNKIVPWDGDRSPFWSYMTHWGPFLFVIISWMISETLDWIDASSPEGLPNSRLLYLLLGLGVLALLLGTLALTLLKVEIAWLVMLLLIWAGLLLLRRGLPDAKRAVLFMTGTALFLTLFVEVARLDGDIDRMNTVFKFYLQAWTLLAVSAGTSLVWLLPVVELSGRTALRRLWQSALVAIVFGIALYPLMAGMDKIRDRMSDAAPRTLDGMAYMASSTYPADDTIMDLSEDYRAIQWMQRSVQGSPVIVEANTPEYQWGSRFTVYTGLPGVVGWNWHQRQQRAITPAEWVTNRVEGVGMFYNTLDRNQVKAFLRRNQVKYIVVGQLERALYSADGLQKFPDWEGDLWRAVYHEGQTTIYEVVQQNNP